MATPDQEYSNTSKRKSPETDVTQHLSIPQLPTCQESKASRSANKRRKLYEGFSDMYSFPASKVDSNGVVDLTNSPSCNRLRRGSGVVKLDHLTPYTGAKRLVVRNLRTTPKSDPSQYCNQTAALLDTALTAIFADQRPALSNEELYKGVENICKLGRAQELAIKLFDRCRGHVADDLRCPLVEKSGEKSVDVLRAVIAAWALWNKQLLTIRSIFFYLDRSHLLQISSPSIHDVAVSQFRKYVFEDALLRSKIVDGTCDLILADRTGDSRDQALFMDAVKMFHELAVYTSDFEARMLHLSQEYIARWADRECAERVLADYVEECGKLIETEMKRCEVFDLDSTTKRALLTLLEHHLIERKEIELTDADSLADLLDIDALDNVEQLFRLLERRRLGSKLKEPFSKWIDDTGTAIVFNEKEQDRMVVQLLALKLKLDKVWRKCFHKNEELGHTLRESFELFINKSKKTSATWGTDNSKPGEMIAKYVDLLLKSGAKAIPKSAATTSSKPSENQVEDNEDAVMDEDFEINNQLDQVLDLFRFVHGKAVFEAFYKKDLARRLLMNRSANDDAEKSMLTRLKNECGAGFTHNLEQMFKDVELSREEMAQYKKRMQDNNRQAGVDLSVNILSSAAWPTYPDIPVIIPQDVKRVIDHFEAHYYQKHSGRKLQWKHALAHCQLRAEFNRGQKELVVSSFQAIVLLLFNGKRDTEHMTYETIKTESGLSEADVKRTLQSLACAKLRPLKKHPSGREIDESDTFTVNANFDHDKYRVKINAIQLKETTEENKETHERVAADRQYETQAAIVRIMKSRKTINHAELIAEVISATKSRGTLNLGDIKKNIDRLIEKEYMERVEGNAYNYLA